MKLAQITSLLLFCAIHNINAACRDNTLLWSPEGEVVLTASSTFTGSFGYYGPLNSKLNTPETSTHIGGWTPRTYQSTEWIQAEFKEEVVLEAIATQGRAAFDQYVESYRVQYSVNGLTWVTYYEGGRPKVFSGNNDASTIVKHEFETPINARYVRLYPVDFHSHKTLRWELYGCPVCSARGILSSPEVTLSASSNYVSADATESRLYYGAKNSMLYTEATATHTGAWSSLENGDEEYIQADLGRYYRIEAVATQGRADDAQWVSQYTLESSDDGFNWTNQELYQGNTDRNTVVKNQVLKPFVARYVRLNPQQWRGQISLRWELYGCPEPEDTCVVEVENPYGPCHEHCEGNVKTRAFKCTTRGTGIKRTGVEEVPCDEN